MSKVELNIIALTARANLKRRQKYFVSLIKFLRKKGKRVLCDSSTAKIVGEQSSSVAAIKKSADLILVFGGDGALLGAVRKFHGAAASFAGIRLDGTLGFLTEYSPTKIKPLLTDFFRGKFEISQRVLLSVEVVRKKKVVKRLQALNEAALTQSKLARLIKLDFSANRKRIATFHADGALVATPTGSTAYSLAAGGPIVDPELHSFILTPINPHLLAHRPLVLPEHAVIQARINDKNVTLTADGQVNFPLRIGDEIIFRKADWELKVIHPVSRNHFEILRQKLNWAERG
ncbi:MAG: NAD(+)/NADH kinase [Patescibacteria group bacterium]